MNQWQADQVLEAQGMICPQPIFQARGRLREMQPGQVLELRGDDPTLPENLAAFTSRSGDELLGSQQGQGFVSYFLRRA